jgi:hypothetical protein
MSFLRHRGGNARMREEAGVTPAPVMEAEGLTSAVTSMCSRPCRSHSLLIRGLHSSLYCQARQW